MDFGSWGVFSKKGDEYAGMNQRYQSGEDDGTYTPLATDLVWEVSEGPDGQPVVDVDVHFEHDLVVVERETVTLRASMLVECHRDLRGQCELFLEELYEKSEFDPWTCTLERTYHYVYVQDLDDLIDLYPSWVEE